MYKGAGVAVFRKSGSSYEILLGRRAINPDCGKWSIPGGKRERRDSGYHAAAFRECLEETGLDIPHRTDIREVDVYQTCIPFFFSWKTFLFEAPESMPVPDFRHATHGSEFSDLQWVPVEQVLNGTLECNCLVAPEIKKYLRGRK